MSTYVYGIAPADRELPDAIEGIGDPPLPVRAVRGGDLVALCSDAPPEPKAERRDLLAHQHVVIEAAKDGPVLPLRFGGISPDDATVAAILEQHHDLYVERLEALAGKDEFNLKVHHDEEAVLHAVLADDPELVARHAADRTPDEGSHGERTPFGELVARAVADRERADVALVERTLSPYAAATVHGPREAGRLANLSFLVERERRDEFLEAVRALHREHEHLREQVTGPLPPYSFVQAG
ncbi:MULTISPECIES: GvpL/GvpF family gas vesicle protein [unclassified Streptomyces]|uniref:GvpL/GvpF family gas vesicle protein n=1 Tax=unclassified Streptomyces TaxID=2593676 RepID=UPI0006AE1802|nr:MULTISPECIES: GvpL/GvpF family gas vesicle protein [unclassified Streptomyces]KOX25480.1 gas vesicle protein [Streptomyces sp. NRRL F-6491]KOX42107.1 gas vesicle protein [Streptomyces sp. NRRL F-6492]